MGKFNTERCVCAPQRHPGGMESEPKVSLSILLGREEMASRSAALSRGGGEEEEEEDGGTVDDPGAKVAEAKTCFMIRHDGMMTQFRLGAILLLVVIMGRR